MQYPMPPKPVKKGGKKQVASGSTARRGGHGVPAPRTKKSMYTLERKPAVKGAKPKWGNPMYQTPRKPKRGRA